MNAPEHRDVCNTWHHHCFLRLFPLGVVFCCRIESVLPMLIIRSNQLSVHLAHAQTTMFQICDAQQACTHGIIIPLQCCQMLCSISCKWLREAKTPRHRALPEYAFLFFLHSLVVHFLQWATKRFHK